MKQRTKEELEPIAKELTHDLNALNRKYTEKLHPKQFCATMLGAAMHNAYMSAPNFEAAGELIETCRGYAIAEALLKKAEENAK